MRTSLESLVQVLDSIIHDMQNALDGFVQNPKADFRRERKLGFSKMIRFMLCMAGNSIQNELLKYFEYNSAIPTTSAFIQQRNKIKSSAMIHLFRQFCSKTAAQKTFMGYRVLAVDGTDLHVPTNPRETSSFFQDGKNKGYNLLHLNALYDLINNVYTDALAQPRRENNERRALQQMVEQSSLDNKTIIVADRGYESYDVLASVISKGWNYVIRIREKMGIASGLSLPTTEEFDTKESLELPKRLQRLLSLTESKKPSVPFRVLRFQLSKDTSEILVTNLSSHDFSSDVIKRIYQMRWGIETSFRELKYSIGLTHFHSKKTEFLMQEIFARLVLFNFSMMAASNVAIEKHGLKYEYQVNFTQAVHICSHFLHCTGKPMSEAEALILRFILPIRPGRKARRDIRKRFAVSFNYRVA